MSEQPQEEAVVVPSLEREAATAAALFLLQKSPDTCREFIQHMRDAGDRERANHRSPSGGGRIRAGFIQWADWMQKALVRQGLPLSVDAIEEKLGGAVTSTDPLEQALLEGPPGPPIKPTAPSPEDFLTPEVEADLLRGVAEDEALKASRRDFIFLVCSKADELLADLVAAEDKGLSALMRPPVIVGVEAGKRAILVQSFTVPFRGITVRHDYKANCRPVVVRHPSMFIQADSQRLVRSKVIEQKKREFYVKGLEYMNGMIFKGYVEAGKRDRDDLATFYQVRGNEVVKITEAEYRQFENLIAAGKDLTVPV